MHFAVPKWVEGAFHILSEVVSYASRQNTDQTNTRTVRSEGIEWRESGPYLVCVGLAACRGSATQVKLLTRSTYL